MDYQIVHTNKNELAKTCHKCKKIVLGRKYNALDKITRDLILEHEKSHSINQSNEVFADFYAIETVSQKRKIPKEQLFKIISRFRDKKHLDELSKMINL